MHTWVIVVIIVVCAIAAAWIITGVVSGNFAAYRNKDFAKFYERHLDPADDAKNQAYMVYAEAMKDHVDEEYDIVSSDGLRLHAYLVKGDPDSDVYVFCSHGYRDPYGGLEFAEKAPIWQSRGYNLFMVDHRAHAKSEGKYLSFGQYEADDCVEWLYFMRETFGEDIRIILHGQSMGAAIVMLMSGKETLPDNVKFVISDCGYTSFYRQCQSLLPKLPKFLRWIALGACNTYLRVCHRIDMKKSDALAAVGRTSLPILFIHGEKDTFVPVRMCHELYEACSGPDKQIEIFPQGTHATCYAHDPERYTRVALDFTDRHL